MLLLAAEGTGVLDAGVAPHLLHHTRTLLRTPGFKPQALGNTLWALAKLGHTACTPLLHDAAAAVVHQGCLYGDTAQAWSNTMWAYATLGHYDPQLCQYVAEQVVSSGGCMRGATPQGWANLLWAFATLGHHDPALFHHAARQAVQHGLMRGATPQGWSTLLWAYATVRHYDPELFSLAVSCRCQAASEPVNPQEASNTLLALATVYHVQGVDRLVDVLLPHMLARLGQHNGQDICNSVWALLVLGLARHPAMMALLREANGRPLSTTFARDGLCQLRQAHVELADLGVDSGLSAQHQLAARLAWRERGASNLGDPDSSFQHQVAAAVLELQPGSAVQLEGQTRDGMFDVDVLVTMPGQSLPLAVEADGHMHCMRNLPGRIDGNTQLRNRQLGRLEQRGLSGLVLVSHGEWYNMSHQAHLELLRAKLAACAGGQPVGGSGSRQAGKRPSGSGSRQGAGQPAGGSGSLQVGERPSGSGSRQAGGQPAGGSGAPSQPQPTLKVSAWSMTHHVVPLPTHPLT